MEPTKKKFNSEFYEDVGDPLAEFRKKNGGARFVKGGKDPFARDPDVMQAKRQQKLIDDTNNLNVNTW